MMDLGEEEKLMRLAGQARLALDVLLQETNWRQRDSLEQVQSALIQFSDAIEDALTRVKCTTEHVRTLDRAICGLLAEIESALELIDNPADVESAIDSQLTGEGGPQV